jgi:hypothetical protein
MKRLEDRIYDALREESAAVGADELARRFLGIAAGNRTAARIVEAALGKDRRFRPGPDGWEAVRTPAATLALGSCAWRVLLAHVPAAMPPGVRVLVAVEYQPGEAASFAAAGYVSGPAEAAREAAAQLEAASADLAVQGVSDLKLLRFLDELFAKPGLFLRGLHSRALGSLLQLAEDTGAALPEHFYPLADVARLVWPAGQTFSAEAILDRYQVAVRREEPLLTELAALPTILPKLAEELAAAGMERLDELADRLEQLHRPLDLGRYAFTRTDLDNLPESPGVYTLLDAGGQMIYVGKSVNLRRRIQGYFRWQAEGDPKLERIQRETHRLVVEPLGSDLEALLEEAARIARHRPAINVQLEVHETPHEKGIQDPLVAVLPHREEHRAVLFVLHPTGRVQKLAVDRVADPALLDRFLEMGTERDEVYPAATIYGEEVFPLAVRWLRKNSHRLTFFLGHDYRGRAELARALQTALAEGKFLERQIFL